MAIASGAFRPGPESEAGELSNPCRPHLVVYGLLWQAGLSPEVTWLAQMYQVKGKRFES